LITTTTGQLRHITEEHFEQFEDVDDDIVTIVEPEDQGNDTNEESLLYFARLSKHYLRLVTAPSSQVTIQRHATSFPVIADSGANYHMFRDRSFFESIQPANGIVVLGDGVTSLSIQGIGTVKCRVGSNILTIPNVRYIPDLSESIYSLFQHIQTKDHRVESSYEDGLFVIFPSFKTKAIIGSDDIYLDFLPISSETLDISSDDTSLNSPSLDKCCHITETQQRSKNETSSIERLLHSLCEVYGTVKTKRQLGLDIPAGFRRNTTHQQNYRYTTPPRKSATISNKDLNSSQTIIHDLLLESTSTTPIHSNVSTSNNTSTNSSSLSQHIPLVRSVDKVSSTLPKVISMSEDFIRCCVGFRRIDTLKQHLDHLYQPTVTLDKTPPDAVLDPGDVATMRKKPRNTVPVPRSESFGDVLHMDIIFGPEISIGNVHYGIIFTDRYSRMTYLYPLSNLTTDIPKQLQAFFAHIGTVPKRLITDFDLKLIGGKARDYLNSLLIHVNAAPSYRQDKNGLAERHWQTITNMARNWLASAELPASFWFYAVRRASEVCNYFPFRLEDGSFSTPFELVHRCKPDLRNLFKPFGLAAVRRERHGTTSLQKFDSQSVPMIAIGKCQNSNGIQFYNPMNGTFVSSIDYVFQDHVTSGSRFGYKYQPGTVIYRLDESNTIFAPKFPLESSVLVHTHSPPHLATVIGVPSYHRPNVYTVKFKDDSIAEYDVTENILEASPTLSVIPTVNLLPEWIKGGANVTLFLNSMTKPKHGKLFLQETTNNWYFCSGKNTNLEKGTMLEDLSSTCQNLLETGQLFRGHAKFHRVYQTRSQLQLKNCVLRHVSAHGLSQLVAPTSLKNISKLPLSDQAVWHAAYNEEFDGLSEIPTWEIISEEQFKKLNKSVKPLPSMAIATIKYDENNKPKRAKYRIVVLGNLDYHLWSKASTTAPVMSQLELRLLTSLAIFHKCPLKNCDIKQAFVQSSLPPDEEYYVKPPVGCPRSGSGTYWRLIRSLYGLKRAPKLWFEKLSSHLKAMGLTSSPSSPCLFVGTLIPGEPPVYVGVYVDDIIYFSPSSAVEEQFQKLLSTIGEVDFMGQVSHFLGIEFNWHHLESGELSVILTQQSFIENLMDNLGIKSESQSTFTTPYKSGVSIDSIPTVSMSVSDQDRLRLQYQSLVGSLNWLAHTTRPDLSTVVSLLAQHQSSPSPGHLDAAIYVVKYLSHTKNLGIYFNSMRKLQLESFLHFPLPTMLLPMSDANWGPQDATKTTVKAELPLFISRSMSAFYVDLFGPLHWISKRQTVTAGSSAEAEIYATSECVKFIIELSQTFDSIGVRDIFMPSTTTIFNDNKACVDWSKLTTTKGLRHIQMRENHVRENVERKLVSIAHVGGKVNMADLFTKEDERY